MSRNGRRDRGGARPDRLHRVRQVAVRAHGRDVRPARDVRAAQARVEHGRLQTRVRAHEKHEVGILHAHQVAGDESRGHVHLRELVREHVAVVVVSSHAKVPLSPLDQFHRRGVGKEVD